MYKLLAVLLVVAALGCAVNGCVCPRTYLPVCSSLGNSYANSCTFSCFAAEGETFACDGSCPCAT